MSLSWLHLNCSFLVKEVSEFVLDLNSCGCSLIKYSFRASMFLTGKGWGQVSNYYCEGCGRSGDKSKYQIPVLILPWDFYIPAQTWIWLKLFLGTKEFLGDECAVTTLSRLLTFSAVGGIYTLDCVQMWKTEKSVTDFNPSDLVMQVKRFLLFILSYSCCGQTVPVMTPQN